MSWPQVGPYVVEEPLGRGGGGEVFRARAPDGGPVALKLMRSTGANERFVRECRVQAELAEGGGFVRVLNAGLSPYGAYLVMPLLTGGTLRDRLRRGPLEVGELLRLGRALAAALGRAHARGFVHRDIKPENVLYDDDDPLLADLGLGKHVEGDARLGLSRSLSATGDVRGTIGYLAPECVRDSKHADPRADVFSLGAVLYEAATGVAAFEARSLLEVLAQVATGKFTPVRAHRPEVPDGLARTIERCLDGVPERRFADGAALDRALRGVARRGGRAAPAPAGRRTALLLGGLALVAALAASAALVRARRERAAAQEAAEAAAVASARALVRARDAAIDETKQAAALFEQGHGAEAEAQVGRVAALESEDPMVLFLRGMARLRQGDHAGARADLDRVLARADLLPAELRGRAHSVRAAARRNLGDLEGARADLRVALDDVPDDALTWSELAELSLAAGQLDEAHEAATQALARQPALARALLSRAAVYAARRDLQRALTDAQAAVEADPTLVQARLYRGFARLGLGDPEGAEDDLSAFLEREPNHREARVGRGDARLRREEWALAIADYDVALAARDDARVRYQRAVALASYGDAKRSDADFEAAAAGGLLAQALTERAGRRSARGDLRGALDDVDRLIAASPRAPSPHLLRAALLSRLDDREGAVAAARRAVELAPAGSPTAAAAGKLLRDLGAGPPP